MFIDSSAADGNGCQYSCYHKKSEELYGYPAIFRHYYASGHALADAGYTYTAKVLPCSDGRKLSNVNLTVHQGRGQRLTGTFQIVPICPQQTSFEVASHVCAWRPCQYHASSHLQGSTHFEIQVDVFDRIEELDDQRIGVCASRAGRAEHDGDADESHCACQLIVRDLATIPNDWQRTLKACFQYPLAIVLVVVLLAAHCMQENDATTSSVWHFP